MSAILIIWMFGRSITSQPVPASQCETYAQQARQSDFGDQIEAKCLYAEGKSR